ncbi:RICIN domain-containing protein [Longispora sp. NPDC051575]|uniref:RICIN domain-containing protein n=1 Tax=Longispora sp. NPDC051575 TaxID=3154943 RepID=UPI00342588CE
MKQNQPRTRRRVALLALVGAVAGMLATPQAAEAAVLPATAVGLGGTGDLRVLDVGGDATSEGSPVRASTLTVGAPSELGVARQRWVLDRAPYAEGTPTYSYQLKHVKSGKCLDTNGSAVVIKACTTATAQRWYAPVSAPNNGVKLINQATNLCLAVTGDSTSDGAGVEVRSCQVGTKLRWALRTGSAPCARRSSQQTTTSLCVNSGTQTMFGVFGTWRSFPVSFTPLDPGIYDTTTLTNYLGWTSLDGTLGDGAYDGVEFGTRADYSNVTGEQFFNTYWLEFKPGTSEYHSLNNLPGAAETNSNVHSYMATSTADRKQWNLLLDFNPAGTTHLQESGVTRAIESSLAARYQQGVFLPTAYTNRIQITDGNNTWRRARMGNTVTGEPKTCNAPPTDFDPIWDVPNDAPWCFTAAVTGRTANPVTDPYEVDSITLGKPSTTPTLAAPATQANRTGTGTTNGVDQARLAACLEKGTGAACLTEVPGLAQCVARQQICNTTTLPAARAAVTHPAVTLAQARQTADRFLRPESGASLAAGSARTTSVSALNAELGLHLQAAAGQDAPVHVITGTGQVRSIAAGPTGQDRYDGYLVVVDASSGDVLYARLGA